MENTSNQEPPFFTISREADITIAVLSLNTYKGLLEKKDAPINRLEGKMHDDLIALMERTLPKMIVNEVTDIANEEDEEKYAVMPADIVMDFSEAFGMLHSIVQTYYTLKHHIDLPDSKKALWEPGFMDEVESLFAETKDAACDLLWRLTQELYYTDYGLQTLEEVFDKKPAKRQLKVDNKKIITTLTINTDNFHLFSWTFSLLNYLEFCQDTSDFARKMYSCQFFHIHDYKYIRDKFKDCKEGDVFDFTLYDGVCLYLAISLRSLLCASDAEDIILEMDQRIRKEKSEITVSSSQVRNYYLKFGEDFRTASKMVYKKHPAFKKYISVVDTWKL